MAKKVLKLVFTVLGVFASLVFVQFLNRSYLPAVALAPRMILLVVVQWIMLLVPFIMMWADKMGMRALGFSREKVPLQIGVGLAIGLGMSLVLTVIPVLFGLKEEIGSTPYTLPWQFAYDFIYKILGVALVEEFIFRGYIYQSLKNIKNSSIFAIVVSSLIFGFFHLLNGNIIQVVMTTLIGAFLCVCKERIKHCTLLSLIIAHGIYDGLITLVVGIL